MLFVLFMNHGLSQTEDSIKAALKNINSFEQIENLGKQFPTWNIAIWKSPEKGFFSDSTINNTKIGEFCTVSDINKTGLHVHKILDRKKQEHCKVQYIFFDGSNKTIEEIDSIRATALDKYAKGIDFNTLQKLYNEDGSPTGILDWFCKGFMVDEFDTAVRSRKKNEVFKVDIPEFGWYYIVLKLEKNTMMNVTHSIMIDVK